MHTPLLLILGSLLAPVLILAQVSWDSWEPSLAGRVGYQPAPTWHDEFNSLDTNTWTLENQAWWDNNELQYYSNDAQHVNVTDGSLIITADNTPTGGRSYTSGRISTKNSVTFYRGMIAARIKMTYSQGIWPAFWMFGVGDLYSEIDIAEGAGGNSALQNPPTGSGDDSACASLIHFNTQPGQLVTGGPGCAHHCPNWQTGGKWADDYHVFWLEWTGTEMWAGVDSYDAQMFVANISALAAFSNPEYVIFNVAVGGDYPQAPDSTTVFPQHLKVDWVRVWDKTSDQHVNYLNGQPVPSSTGESIFESSTASGVESSSGGEFVESTGDTIEGSTGGGDGSSGGGGDGGDGGDGGSGSSSGDQFFTGDTGSFDSTGGEQEGDNSSSTASIFLSTSSFVVNATDSSSSIVFESAISSTVSNSAGSSGTVTTHSSSSGSSNGVTSSSTAGGLITTGTTTGPSTTTAGGDTTDNSSSAEYTLQRNSWLMAGLLWISTIMVLATI